jgi:hypothetical protein
LYDKLEAREKDEARAKELCALLSDIDGDAGAAVRETARKIIRELEQLNRGLYIEDLRSFIRFKKNELSL